ncbi:MAG TPA: helix-turn-helix domain-containing protein [Polyangiaceae bacterium]|jgi:DNA-binding transcriptional regulator YiaG|nr:helix-turn-helix domain-containing protein [Polyangiaceae bacterium]
MQYEHVTRVGRYTVTDNARVTETLSDGSPGITSDELARLERRAAITVLAEVDEIEGGELKFARKALDLSQAELARQLGVTTETVCRWETGKEAFKRQTQLAVLRLLEEVERHGEKALAQPARARADLALRARAS